MTRSDEHRDCSRTGSGFSRASAPQPPPPSAPHTPGTAPAARASFPRCRLPPRRRQRIGRRPLLPPLPPPRQSRRRRRRRPCRTHSPSRRPRDCCQSHVPLRSAEAAAAPDAATAPHVVPALKSACTMQIQHCSAGRETSRIVPFNFQAGALKVLTCLLHVVVVLTCSTAQLVPECIK